MPLVKVEEDWELVLGEPDPAVASPQVSTEMAANANPDLFCILHLNFCDIPTFSPGGLQIQVWQDDTNLAVKTSDNRNTLSTSDEVLTWTQDLEIHGEQLRFGVPSGESDTWGDFGGGELRVIVPAAAPVLDGYSVQYSVNYSGITLGANRVKSMKLLRVRKYYGAAGHILWQETDDTPRVVYSNGSD